jgi:hypothetical protein
MKITATIWKNLTNLMSERSKIQKKAYCKGPFIRKIDKTHNIMSEPAVGPCLCDLASGFVRKLQGTEAKVSEPDI